MRRPDHIHVYLEPAAGLLPERQVRLFCYHDDCAKGLDPKLYPAAKIGPKLYTEATTGQRTVVLR